MSPRGGWQPESRLLVALSARGYTPYDTWFGESGHRLPHTQLYTKSLVVAKSLEAA